MKKKKLVGLFVGMILFLLGCQGVIAQQTQSCPAPGPSVCFCDDFEYAVSTPAPLEFLTSGQQAHFGLNTWYSSPVLFNIPSSSMWATKTGGTGTGVAHEEPNADNFVYNTRQSCSSTTKLLNFTSPGIYRFTTVQRVIDWNNLVWIPNWLVIFNRPPLQPGQSFGDPVIKVELENTNNIDPPIPDPNPRVKLMFIPANGDPTNTTDAFRINVGEIANYLWFHQRTTITNPTTVTLTAELRRADGTQVCSVTPPLPQRCTLTVNVPSTEAYRIVHNPTNNPRDLNIRIYSVVKGASMAARATEIKKVEVIKE